jgi:hypothetical protein
MIRDAEERGLLGEGKQLLSLLAAILVLRWHLWPPHGAFHLL